MNDEAPKVPTHTIPACPTCGCERWNVYLASIADELPYIKCEKCGLKVYLTWEGFK